MELGPNRPSPIWILGPNSIIVVYMDPLSNSTYRVHEAPKDPPKRQRPQILGVRMSRMSRSFGGEANDRTSGKRVYIGVGIATACVCVIILLYLGRP